jgi:hypothetical protein
MKRVVLQNVVLDPCAFHVSRSRSLACDDQCTRGGSTSPAEKVIGQGRSCRTCRTSTACSITAVASTCLVNNKNCRFPRSWSCRSCQLARGLRQRPFIYASCLSSFTFPHHRYIIISSTLHYRIDNIPYFYHRFLTWLSGCQSSDCLHSTGRANSLVPTESKSVRHSAVQSVLVSLIH